MSGRVIHDNRKMFIQGPVSIQHFRKTLPEALAMLTDQLLAYAEDQNQRIEPGSFKVELHDDPNLSYYLLRLTINGTPRRTPKK